MICFDFAFIRKQFTYEWNSCWNWLRWNFKIFIRWPKCVCVLKIVCLTLYAFFIFQFYFTVYFICLLPLRSQHSKHSIIYHFVSVCITYNCVSMFSCYIQIDGFSVTISLSLHYHNLQVQIKNKFQAQVAEAKTKQQQQQYK